MVGNSDRGIMVSPVTGRRGGRWPPHWCSGRRSVKVLEEPSSETLPRCLPLYPSQKQYLVVYTEELTHLRRSPPRPSIARRTARLLDARSNVVSIFTEARCDTGSATLDLPL